MGENIINSKKRILDTKILLKMRIDLENIYESKEKVVEDVQKQTKLVENLNIGDVAQVFEIYEKVTNYAFLKSYITKNKYSDIWKELGVYKQIRHNMIKTYEYIENLVDLRNNDENNDYFEENENEKLDILEKILKSRVYIDYNKNFGKDKLYVTTKEKEELNIYRYDLIRYLEKLKLENRDYDIREDTENIYLNTFKIWAKVSEKIKNDTLYTEETNTILKAVGNNLKILKDEYVKLKYIEKNNKNIEEKEINIFEVLEDMFRIYGRERKAEILKNSR
ncbi:MAG: hypothetical protein HXK70_03530 [Clostridiales bacterium]|nr:hypothetical protein [Clostridiales bacterium]